MAHAQTYSNEVTRIKTEFVKANIPMYPCIGLLVLDYYGMHINSTVCGSRAYAQVRSTQYSQECTDVRSFDAYVREMDDLITTLSYYFRIQIADIVAEYAGARHFTGMNNFSRSKAACWTVHSSIRSFHKAYNAKEMQDVIDSLPSWNRVVDITKMFVHGPFPGAKSFTAATMDKIFNCIIMISVTDPLSKTKAMGFYDFLDFFYELALLILPVDVS